MSSCSQSLQNDGGFSQSQADAICSNTAGPEAGTTAFLVLAGTFVLLMQAGFAALVSGSVRQKNAQNLLVKNLLDMCFGALSFYVFGYGLAYGVRKSEGAGARNPFIGTGNIALSPGPGDLRFTGYTSWFFQAVFAATAATIVSGAVAERIKFTAYIIYAIVVITFVYPLIVHWVWSGQGWLTAFTGEEDQIFNSGVIDFAGSGVVHGVGGFSALIAAFIIGPRRGRFDSEGNPQPMRGHSAPLTALGTLILISSFIVFNAGSQLSAATAGDADVIGRAATTTLIGIAAGGVATLLLGRSLDGIYDLTALCNGMLSGAVAMCSGCPVMEAWTALLTGLGAGVVYRYSSKLLLLLRIDDPVGAAPVHGFAGLWGLLMTGLLASPYLVRSAYGNDESGLLWGRDGGRLFGAQIIFILVMPATVMVLMGALFAVLKLLGTLRITEEEEDAGLDVSHHGGAAYETHSGITTTKA